jgi:hypothetical protein
MCVHLATSSSTRTSSAPMIFATAHRHGRLDPVKEVKVCCGLHCRAKVYQDPYPRVSLGIGISMASGPHPQ